MFAFFREAANVSVLWLSERKSKKKKSLMARPLKRDFLRLPLPILEFFAGLLCMHSKLKKIHNTLNSPNTRKSNYPCTKHYFEKLTEQFDFHHLDCVL